MTQEGYDELVKKLYQVKDGFLKCVAHELENGKTQFVYKKQLESLGEYVNNIELLDCWLYLFGKKYGFVKEEREGKD